MYVLYTVGQLAWLRTESDLIFLIIRINFHFCLIVSKINECRKCAAAAIGKVTNNDSYIMA